MARLALDVAAGSPDRAQRLTITWRRCVAVLLFPAPQAARRISRAPDRRILSRRPGVLAVDVVLGAAILPKTVFLLAGGVISDRLDRRGVLILGDLLMAATQVATALLLWHSGTRQLHLLVMLQILYGCANALAVPALIGVLPQLVPLEGLQRANAVLRTAMNTASVLGPPAAAGFAAVLRPEWALLANAGTFMVSAVAVSRLPKLSAPSERASLRQELVAGWSVFRRTTWVWLMVGSFAIYQATVLPVVFVIGPLVTQDDVGASGWAAVLTARSVGAILGGALLLRWRPRRPVALACALLLLDLPFLLGLSAGLGVVALVLASVVATVGLLAADTLWESALQENVDPAFISRISSYDWMGSVFFAPLGYLAIGAVAAVLAQENYDPRPYPGPALVFQTAQTAAGEAADWSPVAPNARNYVFDEPDSLAIMRTPEFSDAVALP